MSVLGVSVLITALVSAFNAVATEYGTWLEKVAGRASDPDNLALQSRLSEHGPAVGEEYNRMHLVGAAFDEGDGLYSDASILRQSFSLN